MAVHNSDVFDRLDRTFNVISASLEWLLSARSEVWFRGRPSLFSDLVADPMVIEGDALKDLLDAAVESGLLSDSEARRVVLSDVVLRAADPGVSISLVVEGSRSVTTADVRRAAERAALLRKAGHRVEGVVAGWRFWPEALELADRFGVTRVIERELDGEDPTGGEDDPA